MPRIIFVYGTLRTGQRNAARMRSAEPLGAATVAGLRLYDVGPFPGAVRAGPEHVTFGECFRVNARTLRALDAFEGTPRLYRRETFPAVLSSGATVRADAYVYVPSARGLRAVPGGRWDPASRNFPLTHPEPRLPSLRS